MAFICVLLRPYGDKRGSYNVISSAEGSGTHRDKGLAWSAVHRLAMRYPSILVVEFDHRDEMAAAFAIKNRHVRDLHLLVWRRVQDKNKLPGR